MLLILGPVNAFPSSGPTILSCTGIKTHPDYNAPKDVLKFPMQEASKTYTLFENRLTSPELVLSNEQLALCSKTPTEYVYSSNCLAPSRAFIDDWLVMKDAASAARVMAQKYGEYSVVLETIKIDRVHLTVNHEFLSPMSRADFEKAEKNAAIQSTEVNAHFFFFATEFRGKCRISRAKF